MFRKVKLRKFKPHDPDRYESSFTTTQRDIWYSQIWDFKGARQTISELARRTAAYPDEVAQRLIRMFSIKGETVLDPFLGSGTTAKIALLNDRNSISYEADLNMQQIITDKLEKAKTNKPSNITITNRQQ